MLHDAARKGDVEIPFFCYEPKLGEPVGACRMCLVEIEGIPKLQTSCSTPVREGMVVHTRTEQVKEAQSAVVEFLLVNHPLDCPVCDKGGECPLQDISYGWGPGKSRVIDEKRHFEKPIELSPLVAIDRERCILCYRCVRFSQEVSEDAQLQLIERGDRTYVGTFDDRPYVAPFHGNITDICPVGALTSYTYRFRARPWDIEHAGSVCTLCPSQCNVSFTVRDEKVKRVVARDNARGRRRLALRPRPLRVRDVRRAASGSRAAAEGRREAELGRRRSTAGCADGTAAGSRRRARSRRSSATPPTRRATWSSGIVREALGSPHVDSRPSRGPAASVLRAAGRAGDLGQGPRHRRGRRDPRPRHRPAAQLADPRPAGPQGDPPQRRQAGRSRPSARPRSTAAPRRSPATPPARPPTSSPSWRARSAAPRTSPRPMAETPARRRQGRRHLGRADRPRGRRRRGPPRRRRGHRAWPSTDGAGLLEIPDTTNARGLREAGCLPDAGPGLTRDRRRHVHRGDPRRPDVRRAHRPDPLRRRPAPRLPRHPGLGGGPHRRRLRRLPSRCTRTRPPPRPTSSSRSRPTPRKTAPSPTPTAASSASAPPPPVPAKSSRTSSSSPSSPRTSASTPASTPSPPPSQP